MKIFNLKLFFTIIVFIGSMNGQSQTESKKTVKGVYLTYSDFMNNKLTHIVFSGKGKFSKHELTDVIKIKLGDSLYTYYPGEVFGYFDGHDKHRYANSPDALIYSGYFKIKEVGQFIVYEKTVYHKAKRGAKLKGPVRHVFFSKQLNSVIKEMNYENMTEEFHDNADILYVVNKIGPNCKSCFTKKGKNGYNITNEIYKHVKREQYQIKQKY